MCCYFIAFSIKAEQPLLFIVNYPGSPPYLYYDKDEARYVGLIPDILQGLIDNKQLNIRYVSNNRERSEEAIYQNKADLIMLSKVWMKHPDKVISTIPIHQHRSYLYKTTKFSSNFKLDNLTQSEYVCTRAGYTYPNLRSYFNSKRLIRVDVSNHLSMIRMLFKKRCTYVVMNEFNAINLIHSAFFEKEKDSLYRAPTPISTVPLNIVLRAELTKEKMIIDSHIKELKKTGELERLLKSHLYSPKP